MKDQYHIQVIECHREMVGKYPMVYGKGREYSEFGSALVYFQVDGKALRRAKGIRKGAKLTVGRDEVLGVAEAYF